MVEEMPVARGERAVAVEAGLVDLLAGAVVSACNRPAEQMACHCRHLCRCFCNTSDRLDRCGGASLLLLLLLLALLLLSLPLGLPASLGNTRTQTHAPKIGVRNEIKR